MPFLLVEILNFQGSAHLRGVGSLSQIIICAFPIFMPFLSVSVTDQKIGFQKFPTCDRSVTF